MSTNVISSAGIQWGVPLAFPCMCKDYQQINKTALRPCFFFSWLNYSFCIKLKKRNSSISNLYLLPQQIYLSEHQKSTPVWPDQIYKQKRKKKQSDLHTNISYDTKIIRKVNSCLTWDMWSLCFDERNGSIMDATVRTNDIDSLLTLNEVGNNTPDAERVVFPELQ